MSPEPRTLNAATCGRGATPRVEQEVTLSRPNPAGRLKLKFSFRPLQRHAAQALDPIEGTPKQAWRVACNLLVEYFKQIGCFQVADDATVRLWSEKVLDPAYGAQRLLWAIAAKANSLQSDDRGERTFKRIFASHPAVFIEPRILDRQIELSPQGAAEAAAESQRLMRAKLDELSGVRGRGSAHAPTAGDCAAVPELRTLNPEPSAGVPPFVQSAVSNLPVNSALWEALTEKRRGQVNGFLHARPTEYLQPQYVKIDLRFGYEAAKAVRLVDRVTVALELWPELRKFLNDLREQVTA